MCLTLSAKPCISLYTTSSLYVIPPFPLLLLPDRLCLLPFILMFNPPLSLCWYIVLQYRVLWKQYYNSRQHQYVIYLLISDDISPLHCRALQFDNNATVLSNGSFGMLFESEGCVFLFLFNVPVYVEEVQIWLRWSLSSGFDFCCCVALQQAELIMGCQLNDRTCHRSLAALFRCMQSGHCCLS